MLASFGAQFRASNECKIGRDNLYDSVGLRLTLSTLDLLLESSSITTTAILTSYRMKMT